MSDTPEPRAPWLARDLVRASVAQVVAFATVIPIYVRNPGDLRVLGTLGLAYWGVFCLVLSALIHWGFRSLRGPRLRQALLRDDRFRSSRWHVIWTGGEGAVWSFQISLVSLLVVLSMAVVQKFAPSWMFLGGGIVAVVGSWTCMLYSQALHYARVDQKHGGFEFPDRDAERCFSDYVYQAAAGQMTFGSTDVAVVSPQMRRAVTLHGIMSFLFNTVILALLVSLLTG